MADNIVDIAVVAPIKFVKQGYTNPLPYNTKYMEDWLYEDTIPSQFENKSYLQPWQKNDIVYFQVLSNYAPHQLELYDCEGNQVVGGVFQLTYKPSSIEGTGQKVYEAAVALDDFNEGVYQFKILSGSPVLETYVSEWFSLKELHEETVLLEYTHDENDHDVIFETGIVFGFRVHGALWEYQPGADRTIFIDQPRNAVQLAGKSFSTEKLFIGDQYGVPNYMIEKINNIFLCSQVLIDGKQWVGNEGARFEAKREELYPMAGWAFELRPAKSNTKKRFIADGNQGSPTTVTYNIEQKGFGPMTSPASSNIIQIEEITQ
jgi:hypothetical protein